MEKTFMVNQITYSDDKPLVERGGMKVNDPVTILPKDADEVFLGFYLGDLALDQGCHYDEKTQELQVFRMYYNPAFYVPTLGRVIFSKDCFWECVGVEELTDEAVRRHPVVEELRERKEVWKEEQE